MLHSRQTQVCLGRLVGSARVVPLILTTWRPAVRGASAEGVRRKGGPTAARSMVVTAANDVDSSPAAIEAELRSADSLRLRAPARRAHKCPGRPRVPSSLSVPIQLCILCVTEGSGEKAGHGSVAIWIKVVIVLRASTSISRRVWTLRGRLAASSGLHRAISCRRAGVMASSEEATVTLSMLESAINTQRRHTAQNAEHNVRSVELSICSGHLAQRSQELYDGQ